MKNWTKKQIQDLVGELNADEVIEDSEAFDIADGILASEDGLKESIEKVHGVSDAQGWLADRI